MTDDRISKLPKWAQKYIHELEERAFKAECRQEAIQVMHNGAPRIKPNLAPPEDSSIVNGWIAHRGFGEKGECPEFYTACTSSTHHSVGDWDIVDAELPIFLFSSPSLALRSLLPEIVQAYRDEIAATLKMIKEYENE